MRTRVGYTGGAYPDPTYEDLGDHTESVQIDYDPDQISYPELLAVFWGSHNPSIRPYSPQYKVVVFYHNEEQKQAILVSLEQVKKEYGEVYTEILPASTFYLAEDYHQKYNLRRDRTVYSEMAAIYSQTGDLIASTAAARLNGYLGGFGSRAQLEQELETLGLSPTTRQHLLDTVR